MKSRRVWAWAIICFVLVLLLVGAFWLDPIVREWIIEHQNRAVHSLMEDVSRWGDWYEHVIVGFVLVGFARWRRNKRWTRVFISMLAACALAGATARVIKNTAGRARPSVKSELAWSGPSLSEKYHAFPSGHTASSTAFFAVLCLASWRIGVPLLLVPLLIAFSRMYVAAHYLSDVVFAAILGIVCALIVARLMKVRLTTTDLQMDDRTSNAEHRTPNGNE